jgi:hypothetical protein
VTITETFNPNQVLYFELLKRFLFTSIDNFVNRTIIILLVVNNQLLKGGENEKENYANPVGGVTGFHTGWSPCIG